MKVQEVRPGYFRVQPRDPMNPQKRLNIVGDSVPDVLGRANEILRTRRDMKAGIGNMGAHVARIRALTEGPYTFERSWNDYLSRKEPEARRSIAGHWANHFKHEFAGLTLAQGTSDVLSRWERRVAEYLRSSTIGTLYSMFSAAVKLSIPHRISELPWEPWRPTGIGLEPKGERDCLKSMEEVRAVLLAARDRDTRSRRDGWIGDWENRLTVLTFTGMRQGELGGLGWDDVYGLDSTDPAEQLLYIRHQVKRNWPTDHPEWERPLDPPKGLRRKSKKKRPEIVPQRMHGDVVRALRDQRERVKARGWYRSDGPVFPNDAGGWRVDSEAVKVEVFREIVQEAGIKCDLDNISPHSLRHTFTSLEATALILAGGNLKNLAERTRHADTRMLQVYMHATGRGLVAPRVPLLELPEGESAPAVAVGTFEECGPVEPPAIEGLTSEHAEEGQRAVDVAELASMLKGHRDFGLYGKAFLEWDAAGRKTKYPAELSKHFGKVYAQRFMETKRGMHPNEAETEQGKKEIRAAALRSRRAAERRWVQFLRVQEEGKGELARAIRGPEETDAIVVRKAARR